MKLWLHIVLYGIFLLIHVSDASFKCLDCKDVYQPLDCGVVTECGPHEICFMEKFVTNDGIILFDVGCRDPNLCNPTLGGVGKRYVNESNLPEGVHEPNKKRTVTSLCYQCCKDKDICNLDGHCGAEQFKPPTGAKLCYNCPLAKTPSDCNRLGLCDRDSYCSIKQTKNIIGEQRWEHGCSQIKQCNSLPSSSNNNVCSYCCNSELCNRNCTLPPGTVTPPTTTTVKTTTSTTMTTTTTIRTTPIPLSGAVVTNVNIQPKNPKYGETVNIICTASGNPTPKIDFMFRGIQLPNNAVVANNHLTITNYIPINDGDYRCVASNSKGDDYHQFSLQGHY